MCDFASTLREYEREMRLYRAATLIAYGRCLTNYDTTRPAGGGVVVGFSQVQPSASDSVLSCVPSTRSALAELYATSMGRSARQ